MKNILYIILLLSVVFPCNSGWLGDGYCDSDCNSIHYNWDNGDCCLDDGSQDCHNPCDVNNTYMYNLCVDSCLSSQCSIPVSEICDSNCRQECVGSAACICGDSNCPGSYGENPFNPDENPCCCETDNGNMSVALIGDCCEELGLDEYCFSVNGCTDPEACNYDETATTDDGSCLFYDCAGVCGGYSITEILCEDTDGDGFGNPGTETEECVIVPVDCMGIPYGDAVEDVCGICNGGTSNCYVCCQYYDTADACNSGPFEGSECHSSGEGCVWISGQCYSDSEFSAEEWNENNRSCGANNIGNGECDPNCNVIDPLNDGDLSKYWDGGDCCPSTCMGWGGPGTEPCGELGYICNNPCSVERQCNCHDCPGVFGENPPNPDLNPCCCDGLSVKNRNECIEDYDLVSDCGDEYPDCAENYYDCTDTCGGSFLEDNCGNCDNDASNDCIQDCAGNWGGDLVYDECAVCGGDNTFCADECGVPNGDNTSCTDDCGVPYGDNTSCSKLQISYVNISTGNLDITISALDLIAGFQFNLSGLSITDAFGGAAEENDFSVSTSSSTVIGFSLLSATLPVGEYILTQISFDDYNLGDEICFDGVPILSGSGGVSLDVVTGDCVTPFLLGDLNSDNTVNVIDVVMLVEIILSGSNPSEFQMLVADLNVDGMINVLDVVMMVDFILNP